MMRYGDWQTIKEPTYTEKGLRTKTCTGCGDVLSEEIPMLVQPVEVPTVPVEQPAVAQSPDTQPAVAAAAPQIGEIVKQGTDSYQITSTENGDMTVTYAESGNVSAKAVTVSDKVVIAGKEYTVTDIANNAFKNKKKEYAKFLKEKGNKKIVIK